MNHQALHIVINALFFCFDERYDWDLACMLEKLRALELYAVACEDEDARAYLGYLGDTVAAIRRESL